MDVIYREDPYLKNPITKPDDVYLDIETTGLNRNNCYAWVIGYSYVKGDKIISKQLFIDDLSDEKKSLSTLSCDMKEFKRIITYNGYYFDMPFLGRRAEINSVPLRFPNDSIDLLSIIRKNNKFLNIKNLSLKKMEQRLCIERDDPLGGYETLKMYNYVVENNDPVLKRAILNHNYFDIKNLIPMMNIIPIIEDKKRILDYEIEDFNLIGEAIIVYLKSNNIEDIAIYGDGYTIEGENGIFKISIQLKKAHLNDEPLYFLMTTKKLVKKNILYFPVLKEELERILFKL